MYCSPADTRNEISKDKSVIYNVNGGPCIPVVYKKLCAEMII